MANFLKGHNARADIGLPGSPGVAFHIRKFAIKFKKPRLDVSNSEGETGNNANPGDAIVDPDAEPAHFESALPGLRKAELVIEEATMDLVKNIFGGTIQVATADYLMLRIWPAGRAGDFHYFPNMLIEETSHEGEVPALQPISLTLSSDGKFYLYGENKP